MKFFFFFFNSCDHGFLLVLFITIFGIMVNFMLRGIFLIQARNMKMFSDLFLGKQAKTSENIFFPIIYFIVKKYFPSKQMQPYK